MREYEWCCRLRLIPKQCRCSRRLSWNGFTVLGNAPGAAGKRVAAGLLPRSNLGNAGPEGDPFANERPLAAVGIGKGVGATFSGLDSKPATWWRGCRRFGVREQWG